MENIESLTGSTPVAGNIMALLNTDLTTVDLTRHYLSGKCRVKVADMKVEPNNAKTGQNLTIKFATVNVELSTDGKQVAAGHTVIHTISLTPTGKYTQQMILEKLKTMRRMLVGGEGNGAFGSPADYLGMEGDVVFEKEVDASGKYEPKTVVKRMVAKDQTASPTTML